MKYKVSDDLLKKISERVVAAVNPEKVILFGSRASEKHHPNSDIDLMIIKDKNFSAEGGRREELKKIRMAIWDVMAPVDIILFNLAEVEKWGKTRRHIVSEALKNGKVLYAK